MNKRTGVLLLLVLGFVASPAVADTLFFTGTVSPTVAPISDIELLYYMRDASQPLLFNQTRSGFTALPGNCAPGATCALSTSISIVVPAGWAPTFAKYTLLGFYDGGPTSPGDFDTVSFDIPVVVSNPRVFVLTDPAFNGAADSFDNLYLFAEETMSRHIFNGWTDDPLIDHGAFTDGIEFLSSHNLPQFPDITLGGAGATGTIWDYSDGVYNGSATFQASLEGPAQVPEPSTVVLLGAGLGLVAVVTRSRRFGHWIA